MNSFDLAKRMKRLSMDSLSSVPPPPESLPSSFELDCTAFDDMMMSSSSLDRKEDAVNDDTTGVRCRADRDVLLILGLVSSVRSTIMS